MLHYNDDLRLAHYLKEWFYEICQSEKYSIKDRLGLVKTAESSGIAEFENCARP